MNFTQAVQVCLLDKYFVFYGRASRSEFWWFVLFYVLVSLIFGLLFFLGGGMEWLFAIYQYGGLAETSTPPPSPGGLIYFSLFAQSLFWLFILIPSIAAATRRLHDRELSGWLLLIYIFGGMIPFLGFFVVIGFWVILALPSMEGENKYGPPPIT